MQQSNDNNHMHTNILYSFFVVKLGGVEPDTFRLYLEVSVKMTTFEENELLLRNV